MDEQATQSHPAQLHPLVPLSAEVRAIVLLSAAQSHEARTDLVISAFVSSQTGVVSRRQLLAAGVTRNEIAVRLARRQLRQRYRGVYAPGHLHLTPHGQRTAAVLVVPGSVLTHGSATALYGVGGGGTRAHVTVPGNGGRRATGRTAVHTSTTLTADDLAVVNGLPTTTISRAIVDAATHLTRRELANVLARAERASLLDDSSIREVLDRVRFRPTGAHALLLDTLDEHTTLGAQLKRSEVEAALRDIAVDAGLPAPRLNRIVGGDEVDALWPDINLGIEIDSWEFHRDRRSFVADRAKVRRLYLQGLTILSYAASDIMFRPAAVVAELAAARTRAAAGTARRGSCD